MPLHADAVGTRFQASPRTVGADEVLAFAAGLGATEDAFLDDAGPLAALPFYCVSLEWPTLLGLRREAAASLTPAEATRAVHAGQDTIFHRPLRPGETVVTQARLAHARAASPGTICTYLMETTVAETGEPIATTRSTSIYRGVALEGEVTGEAPPERSAPSPVGVPQDVVDVPLSRGAAHVYSACSQIWNPIHTERRAALAAGLPDIILHGTATWALAGLAVIRRRLGGRAEGLRALAGDFTGMVLAGEALRVRLGATGADGRIAFDVVSQSGATVLRNGVAQIAG